MESEIYQFIEESFPEDALEDFYNELDMDGALEEELIALLQAEGQPIYFNAPQATEEFINTSFLPGSGEDFISTSYLPGSGPFSALEELLKQDSSEHSIDYESSGFSSPSSNYGMEVSIDHVFDDVHNQNLECGGSVHSSPISVYSDDRDPLNLENVQYNFPRMFTWEEYQNEMFQHEEVTPVSSPIKKKFTDKFVQTPKEVVKKAPKEHLRTVKRKSLKVKTKKEQNRKAASKYRNKKKDEETYLKEEFNELQERNNQLRKMALDMEQEVFVLRKLLRDML